jgi:transcriptional regulator of acetoin/glycerol metabolism
MATDSASELRAELEALGARRAQQQADDEALAKDVEKALRRAYGKISVAEAARLTGMHRTTVYRVYHPHERRRR